LEEFALLACSLRRPSPSLFFPLPPPPSSSFLFLLFLKRVKRVKRNRTGIAGVFGNSLCSLCSDRSACHAPSLPTTRSSDTGQRYALSARWRRKASVSAPRPMLWYLSTLPKAHTCGRTPPCPFACSA